MSSEVNTASSILSFLRAGSLIAKIRWGFSLKILLILLLAGGAVLSIQSLSDRIAEIRAAAVANNDAQDAQAALLLGRLQAFRYRATGLDDATAQAEAAFTRLHTRLVTEDSKAAAQQYLAGFRRFVALDAEIKALAGAMTDNGVAARERFTEIRETAFQDADLPAAHASGVLQEALLRGRFHAHAYLRSRDDTDRRTALGSFEEVDARFAPLFAELNDPRRRELAEEARSSVAAMRAAFDQARERFADADKELAALDALGPKILQTLTETAKAADTAQALSVASATRTVRLALTANAVFALAGLTGGAAMALLLTAFIARRFRTLCDDTEALTAGRLDHEISGTSRRDEFGRLARGLQVFRDGLVQNAQLRADQDAAEQRAASERRQALMDTAVQFERQVGVVIDSVARAADELQNTSTRLAAIVEESNAQSASVASAAEQADTNVQMVAASAEQLSQALQEVAHTVAQTAAVARDSSSSADESRQQLDTLNDALADVDDVIAAINDVAEQTNLLALNATIEAARAGDAGRGFAVVASEVKGLATQTKTMTERISQRLEAVRSSAVRSIDSTKSIIANTKRISEAVASVSASVEEQSGATSEISRSIQETATGTNEVTRNFNGLKEAVDESSTIANGVKGAAESLSRQATDLRKSIDALLGDLRAA